MKFRAFLIYPLVFAASLHAQERADPRVIWADRTQTRPLFVPQEVLADLADLGALHVGTDQRSVLQRLLAGTNDCTPPQAKNLAGTPEQLLARFKAQDTVLVAEVEWTEPAWSAWYTSVSTLVHLRVLQVLHSGSPRFAAGDEAVASIRGGRLEAFGRVLCAELLQPVPAPGSPVLAFGPAPVRTPSGETDYDSRFVGSFVPLTVPKSGEAPGVGFGLAPGSRLSLGDVQKALAEEVPHE